MIAAFVRGGAAAALFAAAAVGATEPEAALFSALDELKAARPGAAEQSLERLLRQQPNFRLAQWLYGDLLAARSGSRRVPRLSSPEQTARLRELTDELRLRAQSRGVRNDGRVPDSVVQLPERVRYALLMDVAQSRLYLLEHQSGALRVLRHMYAAIGREGYGKQTVGDLRTPLGVYRINSFLNDAELPELYGEGAFTLDYPNLWDRSKGRTGSGIWIHGVPRETYVRAPRSSEGCVTVANADLAALRPYLRAGITPVVVSDRVRWMAPAPNDVAAALERWRRDWSARDTDAYLSHYAADFSAGGMTLGEFSLYKRRVNAQKKSIAVALREVEVYRYPDAEPLVLARFVQDYRSNDFSAVTVKQQFWRRQGEAWKIVREEEEAY